MIEVCVRDEHQIDLGQLVSGQGALDETKRAERAETEVHAHPSKEHRVGEDAQAVEIDQHGGVAEPRQRHILIGPGLWCWFVRRARDVSPDFFKALPEKASAPGSAAAGYGVGRR